MLFTSGSSTIGNLPLGQVSWILDGVLLVGDVSEIGKSVPFFEEVYFLCMYIDL